MPVLLSWSVDRSWTSSSSSATLDSLWILEGLVKFTLFKTSWFEDHSGVSSWSPISEVICSFRCSMLYSSWLRMVIIWLFSELFPLFPTSVANKLVSVVFKRQISFPWPIKTLIPSKFYLKLSSIVRIDVLFFSLFKSKSKLVFLGTSFEKLWLFDFNLCMILLYLRKSLNANHFRLRLINFSIFQISSD